MVVHIEAIPDMETKQNIILVDVRVVWVTSKADHAWIIVNNLIPQEAADQRGEDAEGLS